MFTGKGRFKRKFTETNSSLKKHQALAYLKVRRHNLTPIQVSLSNFNTHTTYMHIELKFNGITLEIKVSHLARARKNPFF